LHRLRRNIKLNDIGNVIIHSQCISDRVDSLRFANPPIHNQGIGFVAVDGGECEVPSTTLDVFLSGDSQGRILIKMDIEGAEWLACHGARDVFSKPGNDVAILLEIHPEQLPKYGGSALLLKEFFEAFQMNVQALTSRGLK